MKRNAKTERARGRPREARIDDAIHAATIELMAERGIHDLRMDAVAERAGVGKAAIYRRYRSKDDLVTAAVAALVSEIVIPNTGSTRGDLLALMREAVELYTGSLAPRLMPSLVGAMGQRPELARTVRDVFLTERRAALRNVLERGIARGDLRADADLELALDVLGGPLFYRLLITGGPLDEQLAEGVADLVLNGFAPGTASPSAGKRTKSHPKRKERTK
jgi:AcrR family transcriptional regulator